MKSIKLPLELHSKLKLYATSRNVSIQHLVSEILEKSITNVKPSITPSELTPESKEFYSKNKHLVESTRTLMGCSLDKAIILSMEVEVELRKFNL